MEIMLSRAEFFAIMAMAGAQDVIGLDASRLLPQTPAERQAMYNRGEASLVARKLLRVAGQSAQLEDSLLRMIRTVAQPERAIVNVKTTPGVGKQLFLHYARGGAWVEQTLPDEQTHRLADVGSREQMRQRLLAIFPVPAKDAKLVAFEASTTAVIAAYDLARRGKADEARATLMPKGQADAARESYIASVVDLNFSGTMAFMNVVPGQKTQAQEVAVIVGAGGAWMITAIDGDRSRVGAVDSKGFGKMLDSLLASR